MSVAGSFTRQGTIASESDFLSAGQTARSSLPDSWTGSGSLPLPRAMGSGSRPPSSNPLKASQGTEVSVKMRGLMEQV